MIAASSARLKYIGVALAAGLALALMPLWLAAQESPIQVSDHEEHGSILVDQAGMTVYTFDDDEDGQSNCTDECLEQWPAVTVQSEDELDGIDLGVELGTFEREDTGELQVTADGQPLYTFVGDQAEGDANGHGLNDVWWVVQVDEDPAAPADDDNGVVDDDDDAVVDDDDETPAPAETGNAGALGAASGSGGVPQQEDDDDNGITDDDDDGVTDDDDGVLDDEDDTPAPAETGTAGLLGGSSGASGGLLLLLAGGALALLSGGRLALQRLTNR